jgi:hypothetical protein
MFFKIKKDGPPVFVEVYGDGRAYAKTPSPCSAREIALFKLFEKGVKDGEIRNIEPGCYHWNFTKCTRFTCEAELTPITG